MILGNYRFAALGPFRVPLTHNGGKRVVDFSVATERVFGEAEAQAIQKFGLSSIDCAVGCYVFALKPSGGKVIWPYYVGQSCRQTLSQRVFQTTDKPKIYNAIIDEYKKAAAYVYLLPLLTPAHRLARKGSNQARIDHAEYALIGMALRVNFDLWNVKERAVMDSFSIDGTPQSWRRDTAPAASFRNVMGFATEPKASGRKVGELAPEPQSQLSLEGSSSDPVEIGTTERTD